MYYQFDYDSEPEYISDEEFEEQQDLLADKADDDRKDCNE